VEDYAGFGWKQPLFGVVFTIFLLSLAGFPGTGGFMAKIYLLQGAVESELWTLAMILALATVVSYYYYLRVAWYMWMRPAGRTPHDRVWAPLPLGWASWPRRRPPHLAGGLPGGPRRGPLAAEGFTIRGRPRRPAPLTTILPPPARTRARRPWGSLSRLRPPPAGPAAHDRAMSPTTSSGSTTSGASSART
jgi:hypothetical protein